MVAQPTRKLTSALIRRLEKVMYSVHGGKSKNRGEQVDVFKIIQISSRGKAVGKKEGLDSHQILRIYI